MSKPRPIPEGMHTVIPSLTIARCAEALVFYKKALGAEQVMSMPAPDGKSIWHAELKVGDSIIYLGDEMPGMSPKPPTPQAPSPAAFWLWVKDCDAAFKRATEAGCTSRMAPADQFWGDRTGSVVDPYGYSWTFATHVRDMTPAEIDRAAEEFVRKMGMKK
jgi:PhnB protein